MAEVKAVAWRYLASLGGGSYTWTRWLDADEKPRFGHTEGAKTEYAYPEPALAALRDEVEQKANDIQTAWNDIAFLEAENHKLRVENTLRARSVELWVPCPDCRDKIDDQGCYVCRNRRLKAENARLREALRDLLNLPVAQEQLRLLDQGVSTATKNAAWLRARAALAEKEGGNELATD